MLEEKRLATKVTPIR